MRSSWKRAAKAGLIGAGLAFSLMLAAGAPAMAQERLEQDFGIIKACAGDVWRLCSDVLPDIGRMKECMQNKMGQLPRSCLDKLLDAMAGSSFKICKSQTYALCAAARCNVYDGVAYCQCQVKSGNSISLTFNMGKRDDVCSVNAAGAKNQYMVSTYSLPAEIVAPQRKSCGLHLLRRDVGGRLCPVRRWAMLPEHGEYHVPGLRQTRAEGADHLFLPGHDRRFRQRAGHQILGPYPCQQSFFKYCKSATSLTPTPARRSTSAPRPARLRL